MRHQVVIWAYVGIGAFAVGAAGAWQIQEWRHDADDKARVEQAARDSLRRAENADRAAGDYEETKTAAEVRERVVIKEVTRVVEKPVYRNECLDDDGLRILAADIQARTASGKPAAAVPRASDPR